MGIQVRCPGCGKTYQIRDELAGKTGRCKGCGSIIKVPLADDPGPVDLGALDLKEPAEAEHRLPEAIPAPPPIPRAPRVRVEPAEEEARSPYLEWPGLERLERWATWIPIVIVAGFLILMIVRTFRLGSGLADAFGATAYGRGRLYGELAKTLGKELGKIVGVVVLGMAPLCMLGIVGAAKILKVRPTSSLYLKSLAIACVTLAVPLVYNEFNVFGTLVSVEWYVTVPIMLGLLWVLVRQRPAPFAVTGGAVFVTLCVPYIALHMWLSSRLPVVYWTSDQPPSSGGAVTRAPAGPQNPPPNRMRQPREAVPAPSPGPGSAQGSRDATGRAPAGPRNPVMRRTRAEWEELLKKVGVAATKHADTHDGQLPASVRDMVDAGLLEREDGAIAPMIVWTYRRGTKPPYPKELILAYDMDSHDGKRTMLFADGQVLTVTIAEFHNHIRKSMEAAQNRGN